jgi:hypothetical protein
MTRGAKRVFVLVATLVCAAAPARALVVQAPLALTSGGCLHDPGASAVEANCASSAHGLEGAAALAVGSGRLFVAASDAGTVTALPVPGTAGVARPGRSAAAIPELAGVDALAVAPGGGAVYAGSTDGDAVVGLAPTTLAPLARGCVARHASARCAALGTIGSVGGLALSPDGRDLYAATFGSAPGADTLVALARSPSDGSLTLAPQAPCVQSLGSARAVCPVRAPGLEGLSAVIVTADGRFAYAASPVSSAVVVLRRNRTTGSLTPLKGNAACLRDASVKNAGNAGCTGVIAGLRGARALALSPDQTTLIVTADDPGSVVALRRNRTTGTLALHRGGCLSAAIVAGCANVSALRGAQQSIFAGGGHSLLVAALGANAVVALGLDGAGALAAPTDPVRDLGTLSGPTAITAGAGAPAVYVASELDDSVVTLSTAGR